MPTKDTLAKNKYIAAISVIASLIVSIKIFLDVVPMPATETDIHRIEKSHEEISAKVDIVTDAQLQTMSSEIESLERNREAYALQKLQIEKQLNDAIQNKARKGDIDMYLKNLAQIEKNIRSIDQSLKDMVEKRKRVEDTLY